MWPDKFQCAVCFTFDFDSETPWIEENQDNINRLSLLSLARYGSRIAIPSILALLERHEINSTFFVPGKVAEDHPQAVDAISGAGHELAAHGYTHTPPMKLSHDEEEGQLTRTKEILEAFGSKIEGYRAPLWEISENTLPLLQKHGFKYSSNLMDDIRPYRHARVDVIELPVHFILDDWTLFGVGPGNMEQKIARNSEVREIWESEFEAIRDLGGLFVLGMHPQVIGRPSRLKMLDEFVSYVKSHENTWIATCSDVAKQARDTLS
jgi:peptidoglycan/xylan/chitin deacetylase (PgdA/CDA1 family)